MTKDASGRLHREEIGERGSRHTMPVFRRGSGTYFMVGEVATDNLDYLA